MSLTIYAAAQEIQRGTLSPVALVEKCLERIDRYEAQVKAWVFVDRDGALATARRLEGELKRGHYRGPLHGIPLGIKDIFDVHDWPTACGSRLWHNAIARHDCTVVRKLREAGAIFLGKTVTTQYASFDPPVTRNPWNHALTPGGSSSGSAAAVACGMCLGAIASQTGGSITRPASYCGVAGCKPTYGRVSCQGVMPLAHSMDHPGPITTCVRDLAIFLRAIAGHDPLDPMSQMRPVPDYAASLESGRRPARIGRLRQHFAAKADPIMNQMMDHACRKIADAGGEVVDVALPAAFSEVLSQHRIIMAVEALQFHAERLQAHPEDYEPKIKSLLEEGVRCSALDHARAKEHQQLLSREVASCFEGVDALIMPATVGPPPDASTTGDPAMNSPWSYTGLPVVSFRTGWTNDGLPLCVQLVAGQWHEAELFAASAWCEQVLKPEDREPPLR